MTGGEILARALRAHGVDHLFFLMGGPMIDTENACQDAGIRLHYAAHITGHGWRKLMRLEEPFVYRMTDVGRPQAVFEFIQNHGPVDLREMYATFNMGAGFAAYVDAKDAEACVRVARESNPCTSSAASSHRRN